MVDRLAGLRHYAVISSNHYNYNVGYLCTPGPHGSKRLVAWRIKKCNFSFIIGQCYFISTDVLGNAPGFAAYYICFANKIKERCFTMVNVPHYGHYRRPLNHILWLVRLIKVCFLILWFYKLNLVTKLVSNNAQGFSIQPLIYGNKHTQAHTG